MEPLRNLQDIQLILLKEAELRCFQLINATDPPDNGLFCDRMWDGLYCWPYTVAGETAVALCPDYIHGFNPKENASKTCTDSGTWWTHPEWNNSWTNYSLCGENASSLGNALEVHTPVIKAIAQVGYTLSLTLLLIASLLLGSVRRLRCPRNNLHLQLFASFILRASLSLLQGVLNKDNSLICKMVTSAWQYGLMANYCWILMEGLYLHNLVFLSMFTDTTGILKYGILGWGLPVLFVVPWIIVKATLEDNLCWTVNEKQLYFWIIRGPITISIVANLIFFVNITRVLFLKMFSSRAIQVRRYRYRKWFKSTLVLVPLFGVHYGFLLTVSLAAERTQGSVLEVVWLYIDQTFASFQGSFVALLYCFLNGEVQSEVRKCCARLREQEGNPQNSLLTQSLTYLSKGRSSVQSLHTFPERKDNWRNGDATLPSNLKLDKEKQLDLQQHGVVESLL